VAPPRWYFNLLVTFVLSGLWHGANWTFVLWGAINGGNLIAGTLLSRWLTVAATRMQGGDLSQRVHVKNTDEIGTLLTR